MVHAKGGRAWLLQRRPTLSLQLSRYFVTGCVWRAFAGLVPIPHGIGFFAFSSRLLLDFPR